MYPDGISEMFLYDEHGRLMMTVNPGGEKRLYDYHSNVVGIENPTGGCQKFVYDALNRVTTINSNGNLAHAEYAAVVDELGALKVMNQEPAPDVVTWVYEDGSYVPSAKLVNEQRYSIVSDYLGRPVQAYSDRGELVWQTDYDIYGGLRSLEGEREFIPFRQLGQYEDEETGLYYNRFRWYDPNTGNYISQDPIGLLGNKPPFMVISMIAM